MKVQPRLLCVESDEMLTMRLSLMMTLMMTGWLMPVMTYPLGMKVLMKTELLSLLSAEMLSHVNVERICLTRPSCKPMSLRVFVEMPLKIWLTLRTYSVMSESLRAYSVMPNICLTCPSCEPMSLRVFVEIPLKI